MAVIALAGFELGPQCDRVGLVRGAQSGGQLKPVEVGDTAMSRIAARRLDRSTTSSGEGSRITDV